MREKLNSMRSTIKPSEQRLRQSPQKLTRQAES
jgi:hypothetical protein